MHHKLQLSVGGPDDAAGFDEEAPLKSGNGLISSLADRSRQSPYETKEFKLFLALYVVFFAPVLWSLTYEILHPTAKAPAIIPMEPSTVGLFGWTMTVMGLYPSLRFICAHLGWKHQKKSPSQHKEDLLRIARLSASLGIIGRVANRVHSQHGLVFLLAVCYFTWFFTIMFEVSKSLNITLTPECINNPFTVFVSITTTVVIVGVLGLHCLFASRDRDLAEYLGFISLGFAAHAVLFFGPGKAHVHVHHWYWAWAISHMCVFDSQTSAISQAMYLGAYVHGVALFGVEKCFYESAADDCDNVCAPE